MTRPRATEQAVLFHNAVVSTVDDRQPRASWFTVLGDRFQWVGDGPPPAASKAIDLGGNQVVPGFVDAHTHFFQTGLDWTFVDAGEARNLKELGECLLEGASKKRAWLFAHSYEEEKLDPGERLTRDFLDELFNDRPVWVNRVDYHSAVVNTAAMRRLEMPPGISGMLMEGGKPNGTLRSEAYFHGKSRVARFYPVEIKERAVKTAADGCISHGITAVHALEGGRIFGDEGVPTLLKRLHLLPLDLTLFLQEKNIFFTERLGFEHLGGCILIDGSIGSYTAALDEDYADAPRQRGVLYEKPREFANFVEEAHVAGVQLAFHAIGPRAIKLVLESYARALKRYPRWDHRHRIEHFELATDDQIAQARDLGLVVSMQPNFEYHWGGPDGMYAARLGERWRRTNRFRTILDAGIVLAGGSDTNVTPPEPLLGIHAAVNHPNPEQRIALDQALRMMTIDAAYSGFNEKRHGSISPGKEASFVVLDRELATVPPAELKDVRVLQTWSLGRCVFRESGSGRPAAKRRKPIRRAGRLP